MGGGPADIAVGDVDADGKLDAVTADAKGNTVTILLGNGRGGFRQAPGSPFNAGPKPHLVALGDLDQDRRLDLAVTEHDSNDVRLFLGKGDGRFAAASSSPVAALQSRPPHNHGLRLGDLSRDGKLDIVTANQNHHSVSVLLGKGGGRFAPAPGSPFPVGRAPYPLALGDVNGDGKLDIVAPNVGGNTLSVLLGDGKGGFMPAAGPPLAVKPRPYYVAIGDVDGDTRLDLIATHDDIALVTVLRGDGRGGFRPAPGSPVDAGQRGWKIVLGDLDRDGTLDLASGADNAVVVLLGDGQGGFRRAPGAPFPTGRGPSGIAMGDLNGDGKLDLLTSNADSNDVTVLLGK